MVLHSWWEIYGSIKQYTLAKVSWMCDATACGWVILGQRSHPMKDFGRIQLNEARVIRILYSVFRIWGIRFNCGSCICERGVSFCHQETSSTSSMKWLEGWITVFTFSSWRKVTKRFQNSRRWFCQLFDARSIWSLGMSGVLYHFL